MEVATIIQWAWIHYRVKLKETEALTILLNFLGRLIADNSHYQDLYLCMREAMRDYGLFELDFNVYDN